MRSLRDITIDDLLIECVERNGSDLHVTVGLPPTIRVDGELEGLEYEACTDYDTQRLIYDALQDREIEQFEETRELDFSYGVKGVSRFRFNVYRQRGSVGAAMRTISDRVPTMEEMGLPHIDVLKQFCGLPRGLVLVTGPTGSGKSTTLATMINHINQTRNVHVMTIENPIEFMHQHRKAMINQRELGKDTYTYTNALRSVLREDPDIVLIGEMRDMETIQATLEVAETGHLVFSTLHTNSAPATIDRIIDVFPPNQQEQVRVQLAGSIQGVLSQQLIPLATGPGRTAVCELMIANDAIRALVRDGKTFQISQVMELSRREGMETMDDALANLVAQGHIMRDDALRKAVNKDNLVRILGGQGRPQGQQGYGQQPQGYQQQGYQQQPPQPAGQSGGYQ
jgi:twitching motility protein PilT